MRLGFVVNLDCPYFCGLRPNTWWAHWFLEALPAVPGVEIEVISDAMQLEISRQQRQLDAYIFQDVLDWAAPRGMHNVEKITPKVACSLDPHSRDAYSPHYKARRGELFKRYNFDAFFFQHTPSYFHSFYPKEWRYWQIPFGVSDDLYRNVASWAGRDRRSVLLTGMLGGACYAFRDWVRGLPGVVYRAPGSYHKKQYIAGPHDSENYGKLLQGWGAAIASGYSLVNKYFEIPASGCVLFAHVDEENDLASCLPFVDNESAVVIDRTNAADRIGEYLTTVDDPRWERIAAAGREVVMRDYVHSVTAKRLIDKVRGLVEAQT